MWPLHSPSRTRLAKSVIRSSTPWTSATTSTPSTTSVVVAWHSQGDVQDGAILRDVDVLAREHCVSALGDSRLLRELPKELERLVDDQVLRIVEVEIRCLHVIAEASVGITRK